MVLKQSAKALSFLNSVGVNIHMGYPQYQNTAAVKAALVDMGIRHVRDGGRFNISKWQELGALGIKTLYITNPFNDGIVPNNSYVITKDVNGSIVEDTTLEKWTVNRLVAELGASNLSGIEGINEIDLNVAKYKWSQSDQTPISQDHTAPYGWVNYLDRYLRDLKAAMAADPNCNGVPLVSTALGGTYNFDNNNPMKPIGDAVDFGNGHYYETAGNGFNDGESYIGINRYYSNVTFPGNLAGRKLGSTNLGEGEENNSAPQRIGYEQPFGGKPIMVTEAGWHTGSDSFSVSYETQAKLAPRMFVEFFRLGFPRTYWYEFINHYSNADGEADREGSFGLIQTNLTYKPAAVQLKALMAALADGTDNRTSTDSLDYNLALTMPTGYYKQGLVKDVLVQKSNGNFVLMVYHNIGAATLNGGRSTPITHPDVAATLTLPRNFNIKNTTLGSTSVAPTAVTTSNVNSYTFNINDTVTILELSEVAPTPPPEPPVTPPTTPTGSYVLASIGTNANLGLNTTLLLDASGDDMWHANDNGSYYYKQAVASTPTSITVKVDSFTGGSDPWAKAGIMIRDSLANDTKNVFFALSRNNGLSLQVRDWVGQSTYLWYQDPVKVPPTYLRLTRDGSTLTAQTSMNGALFTTVYTTNTFSAVENSYIFGIAATSHNNSEKTTVKFTDVVL